MFANFMENYAPQSKVSMENIGFKYNLNIQNVKM